MGKKGEKYPAEVLSLEEIQGLFAACNTRAASGLRNRALLAVLYRAGLRIGEALALRPADIDEAAATIRILHGKGDRARTVGIDPVAMAIVQRWTVCRRERGLRPRLPLFCTLRGKPLSTAYIRQLLPRLACKAGIARRVHAHALRHTHAAELMQEGVHVGIISKQLGHASIATTAQYLDHICPRDVIQTMHSRQWSP